MSNADDIFWRRFGMILAILTLFGFVVAFIARNIAGDAHQASMNSPVAVAERIAPEGSERVGDPTKVVAPTPKAMASAGAAAAPAAMAVASGPVSAEQTYNTACMACHASGVAGAPKKGDATAWAPRIAQGEDALVQSVIKGKGAMPPKAGHPNLTDEQIRGAVRYMIGTDADAETKVSTTAKEAVAAVTSVVKDAAVAASDSAEKAVEQAKSMAESAGETIGNTVGQAASAAGATVSHVASSATSAASAAAGSVAAAVGSAMPAAGNDGKPGNEVYNMGCVACHATGAANAPKLTDKAAWEPRAATGIAAMQQSVIKGKGAMPPRAGLTTLSDADIENAIRYMLKEAGVEAGS